MVTLKGTLYDYQREQVKQEIVRLKDNRHLSFEQISIEIEDLVGHKLTRQEVHRMYKAKKEASYKNLVKNLEIRQVAKLLATGHLKKDIAHKMSTDERNMSLYTINQIVREYPGEMNEAKLWAKLTIRQMLEEGCDLKEIRKALTIAREKPSETWLMGVVAEQWEFIAESSGTDNREAVLAMYKLTGDVDYARAVGRRFGIPVNAKRLSKGVV